MFCYQTVPYNVFLPPCVVDCWGWHQVVDDHARRDAGRVRLDVAEVSDVPVLIPWRAVVLAVRVVVRASLPTQPKCTAGEKNPSKTCFAHCGYFCRVCESTVLLLSGALHIVFPRNLVAWAGRDLHFLG